MALMTRIHQGPNPEYLPRTKQFTTAIRPVQLNLASQDAEQRIPHIASFKEKLLIVNQANSKTAGKHLNGVESRDVHSSENGLRGSLQAWMKNR